MNRINIIEENSTRNEYYSVHDYMFKHRELLLDDEVDAHSMTEMIARVMYLDRQNPGEKITLYIISPGLTSEIKKASYVLPKTQYRNRYKKIISQFPLR